MALLVNLLRTQGIEVGRAISEIAIAEDTFGAGSYVIKRDQPYGRLAGILLQKQDYPDPALRTYDDSGWTLGMMLHVEVKAIADRSILDVPVQPVERASVSGQIAGDGRAGTYAVAHHGSNNLITLRYRLKDLPVRAAQRSFTAGGREFPAGSLLIAAGENGEHHGRVRSAVAQLGLTGAALQANPDVAAHDLELPRLAVYSTWGNTQDVGWVRHALDRFEVPFDLIYKEQVREGGLRGAYDVILMPSQGRTAKGLVYDVPPRGRPLAYTRTERFEHLGMYGQSEDITGGMGLEGALELRRFVEDGGLLITLGVASFFPPEFGLARSVDVRALSAQFYAPRPIVEAEILKPEHPLFYGYGTRTVPVKYANGPLLQVPERDRDEQVLMRFPGGDSSVLSGLMRGADQIRNRPAIVDVPVGRGRILLFATNPIYRWQNHGEFNMVFNALLHHRAILSPRPPAETTAGVTPAMRSFMAPAAPPGQHEDAGAGRAGRVGRVRTESSEQN